MTHLDTEERHGGEASPRTEAHAAGPDAGHELGRLMETCRNYLLLVARHELPDALRAKGGASDLVQETFLVAHEQYPRFKGSSEQELRAWLKGILKNTAAHFRRGYLATQRRGIAREVGLDSRGPGGGGAALCDDDTSPSGLASRHEMAGVIQAAMVELGARDRQVLCWREKEGLTFEEMGTRLGISAVAARKAWFKAVERLQQSMAKLIPATFDALAAERTSARPATDPSPDRNGPDEPAATARD
jgi:RNA polymerase sigma-70 factor (ECF subfamily)